MALVHILLLVDENYQQLNKSLKSIINQTYTNWQISIVCNSNKKISLSEIKEVLKTDRKLSRVKIYNTKTFGKYSQTINSIFQKSKSKYFSFLRSGEEYFPERIRTLLSEAERRKASLLISYVEFLDIKNADNIFFKNYSHSLLANISLFPNISVASLWHDYSLTLSNLFFSKKIFNDLNGFRDLNFNLHYDFFMRASVIDEPVIIPLNLLNTKSAFLNPIFFENRESLLEKSEIIKDHLSTILECEPKNKLSDIFNSHPFIFAGIDWSQPMSDAFDSFVEQRIIVEPKQIKNPHKNIIKSNKRVVLLTHELSLTGAPVIIMEMASLFIKEGYSVNVLSPSDGPLRKDFEQRGIKVSVLKGSFNRLESLERYLVKNPEPRRELIGFFKWVTLNLLKAFKKTMFQISRIQFFFKAKGPILVNSIAAWEWAFFCLRHSHATVIWYIHETFDPKWIASEAADVFFRKSILNGKLKMIFGSIATQRLWEKKGYSGEVKYWSGIHKNDFLRKKNISNKKSKMILNVGSIGSRKGTRVLLEAFAFCRKHRLIQNDVTLYIVGTPNPSGNQEARDLLLRTLRKDLVGSVRLVGNISPKAVQSYYNEADIYVHASFFDCMPIGILSAMARGMPIVATDVDGCGEAIINEETGLLVPPRCPEQLAQAIARLVNNEKEVFELGRNAKKRFSEVFSAEATFPKIFQILK